MNKFDTRTKMCYVFGNTAEELEASALEEAVNIFGADVELAVDRNYEILNKAPNTAIAYPVDKNLSASIRVRVMNALNPAYTESEDQVDDKRRPIQVNITNNYRH